MSAIEVIESVLSVLRFASPLILAAMAGVLSERSGVIQIGLEGMMLFGAFSAASVAYSLQSGWTGLVAGGGAGMMISVLYAVLVIHIRADQIVAGTIVNMLAWGGIPVMTRAIFNTTASTPALSEGAQLWSYLSVLLAFGMSVMVWFVLEKLPIGLWLTVAGEKPEALKAVGISVAGTRWAALMMCGLMAGLSGAILSISLSSSYSRNMTAGRGFMALAALILGKWRPMPAVISCLLLGLCEFMQIRLQGVKLGSLGEIPVQLVQVIPYVVTLVLLAGFIGESRAPSKLGDPSVG